MRIVTDSTFDLPEELVAEFGIYTVPLFINVSDDSYLDGVGTTRKEFYQRLPDFDPTPTIAKPGVDAFRSVYKKLVQEGASEILPIHSFWYGNRVSVNND